MAAIFQIRRGVTNVSLAEGELYLHQGSGSLQFGSGSDNYNLLTLDAPVNGNVKLTGDIEASNAYFTGDVSISGNLFLGNNTSDNISALGVFTTDIKPGTANAYNIGAANSEWKTIYAQSISASVITASVNGINITTFSSSVSSQFTTIGSVTSSYDSRWSTLSTTTASLESRAATLATYTGSVETRLSTLSQVTSSILSWSSSAKVQLSNLESKSASVDVSIVNLQL